MALTGFDLPSAAIRRKDILDLNFSIMERHIDLNKLDFDLNEAPLLDLNADCSRQEPPPHDPIDTSCPKKGGWLELFHNMFGQNHNITAHPVVPPFGNSDANHGLLQIPSYGIRMHNGHPCGYHENGIWNNERFPVFPHQNELQKDPRSRLLAVDSSSVLQHNCRNVMRAPFLPFADHVSQFLQSGSMDRLPFFSHPALSCSTSSNGYLDPYPQVLPKDGGNRYPRSSYTSFDQQDNSDGINKVVHNNGCDWQKAPLHFDLNSQPDMESDPLVPSEDVLRCASTGKHLRAFNSESHCSKISSYAAERKNYYKRMFAQALDGCENNSNEPNQQKIFRVPSMCSEQNLDTVCHENGDSPSNSGKAFNLDFPSDLPLVSGDIGKGLKPIVKIISSPNWLPPGWITELKTRKAGSTAGTTDKYYKDPVTGRRFRSKNEVMSFLQTGRSCKYKSGIRFLDVLAPATSVSASSPQDLENKPPPSMLCQVTDADAGQTMGSCNTTILERVSVKEEPDILLNDGTGIATGVLEPCKSHIRSGIGLNIPDIQKPHSFSSQENFLLQTNKESERQNKRLKISHGMHGLMLQHIPIESKRLQSPNDISNSLQEKCEIKTISVTEENVLLCKEEQAKAQGEAVAPAASVRYRANGTVSSLCERKVIFNTSLTEGLQGKDFCPKIISTHRVHPKKITKLTLKQERELFISLGRKLCRQFLTSANQGALL